MVRSAHIRLHSTTDLIILKAIGGLELLPQVPPYLPRYASFLFSFLGRGICEYWHVESRLGAYTDTVYVFIGSIIIEGNTLRLIAGLVVVVIGLAYCALEFAPQIEPPSNMRDADAGWGAEQV